MFGLMGPVPVYTVGTVPTVYMLGKDFQPAATLTEADLRSLWLEKAVEQKTGATSIYD